MKKSITSKSEKKSLGGVLLGAGALAAGAYAVTKNYGKDKSVKPTSIEYKDIPEKKRTWRERVLDDIDKEGFDYTFEGYDDYENVKDAKFHQLRKAYLSALKRLASQIKKLSAKEKEQIEPHIDKEGFDYAVSPDYNDWKKEIKNENFHKLRKLYATKKEALSKYIGYKDGETYSAGGLLLGAALGVTGALATQKMMGNNDNTSRFRVVYLDGNTEREKREYFDKFADARNAYNTHIKNDSSVSLDTHKNCDKDEWDTVKYDKGIGKFDKGGRIEKKSLGGVLLGAAAIAGVAAGVNAASKASESSESNNAESRWEALRKKSEYQLIESVEKYKRDRPHILKNWKDTSKYPKIVRFWDDLKGARKSDKWTDVTMPMEFRHYEKLVGDERKGYSFYSIKEGNYWAIKNESTDNEVAKFYKDKKELLVGNSNDLIKWLKNHKYISENEKIRGGKIKFTYADYKKLVGNEWTKSSNEEWLDLLTLGYSRNKNSEKSKFVYRKPNEPYTVDERYDSDSDYEKLYKKNTPEGNKNKKYAKGGLAGCGCSDTKAFKNGGNVDDDKYAFGGLFKSKEEKTKEAVEERLDSLEHLSETASYLKSLTKKELIGVIVALNESKVSIDLDEDDELHITTNKIKLKNTDGTAQYLKSYSKETWIQTIKGLAISGIVLDYDGKTLHVYHKHAIYEKGGNITESFGTWLKSNMVLLKEGYDEDSGEMRGEGMTPPTFIEWAKTRYDLKKNGIGSTAYAKGGKINNQYEGREPEDIWNNLTIKQREHFLADHFKVSGKEEFEISRSTYSELPSEVETKFWNHVSFGEYADGGGINTNKPIINKEHEYIKFPNEHDTKKGVQLFVKGGIKNDWITVSGRFNNTVKFINHAEFKKAIDMLENKNKFSGGGNIDDSQKFNFIKYKDVLKEEKIGTLDFITAKERREHGLNEHKDILFKLVLKNKKPVFYTIEGIVKDYSHLLGKKYEAINGNYLTITPDKNGLKIKLTKKGKEQAKEIGLTESNFYDLFEDINGNSEYSYHRDGSEALLGLTSAPMITDGYYYDDDENKLTDKGNESDSRAFAYMDYQVSDFAEQLMKNGEIYFQEVDKYKEGGNIGKEKAGGRGWGKFEKGKRITDIKDLKFGKLYLQHTPQFNSNNIVEITSGDKSGLKRDIVYASFVRPDDLKSREEYFSIWGFNLEKDTELYEIKGREYKEGGNIDEPVELKGYSVNIYKSDDSSSQNVVSNDYKRIVLVTDGKNGDSSTIMSDKPYLKLVRRNMFNKEYLSAIPVNFGVDDKHKMFGGKFVWSSDSRFREDISERPIQLHDRVENYSDGGELGRFFKEGSDKWGLERTEIFIKENGSEFDIYDNVWNEDLEKWEIKKIGTRDNFDSAKEFSIEHSKEKYDNGGEVNERITARNWWSNTLSTNEQKKFLIDNAPEHSEYISSYPTSAYSFLSRNIYDKGDDTILNIWKKEGSPAHSEWLEKQYGYGDLTDKELSKKIALNGKPAEDKIKLVVIDEHTLGYIDPLTPNSANVLHASILKGATFALHPDSILLSGKNVRLASEKDFDDFRVSFEGYKNDPAYEYAKYANGGGVGEHKYYDTSVSLKGGYDLYSTNGEESSAIFIGNYKTLEEAKEIAKQKGLEARPIYMRYANGGGVGLKEGDYFTGDINGKYDTDYQLFNPHPSYVLESVDNGRFKVLSVLKTPHEALEKRKKIIDNDESKTNKIFVHWDVFDKYAKGGITINETVFVSKSKEGEIYSVEQNENGVWTIFSESKSWAKRDEFPNGFPSKEDAILVAKEMAGLTKEFSDGGAVGEKYKTGDFVFAKIFKDETLKVPFIVSHWSHDKYYILGDGSHYVSEENLSPATEKDFDDYYGEQVTESFKRELNTGEYADGGDVGKSITSHEFVKNLNDSKSLAYKYSIIRKWSDNMVSDEDIDAILDALIADGVTDADLHTKPTKTGTQYEKALQQKINEIWKRMDKNYSGKLKGNQPYSVIRTLVDHATRFDDTIIERYKNERAGKYAKGGTVKDSFKKHDIVSVFGKFDDWGEVVSVDGDTVDVNHLNRSIYKTNTIKSHPKDSLVLRIHKKISVKD